MIIGCRMWLEYMPGRLVGVYLVIKAQDFARTWERMRGYSKPLTLVEAAGELRCGRIMWEGECLSLE